MSKLLSYVRPQTQELIRRLLEPRRFYPDCCRCVTGRQDDAGGTGGEAVRPADSLCDVRTSQPYAASSGLNSNGRRRGSLTDAADTDGALLVLDEVQKVQAGRRRSSTCGMPTPVPITLTVNHGVTKSVYFLDPDGNELEVYSDNPAEEVKTFENPYAGVENLEFAQEYRGSAI